MSDIHPTDFFVAGGTLKGDAPSYVERPADEELYQAVKRGEFCYVLTARQMGKSSLMARTARRLRGEGVQTAIIDLTQIGTVAAEQWYFDFVSEVATELDLETNVEDWWQANASQGIVRRFTNFLRDVVLTECEGNIVIFVDEIDFTLSLEFADDYFAAIRAVFNNRSRDNNFERLTFVLMGVAAPSDLVQDQTRTPFNVGRRVALHDFSQNDMFGLERGIETVYPRQGKAILTRIYYWTHGHPYLTQKLCKAIVAAQAEQWSPKQTDQLVSRFFLRQEASKEDNLAFVRNFILNQDNTRDLLTTYRQVWRRKEVVDNERSPVINQLKLSGLVKTEGGYLHNRNEIYRQVFDVRWIRHHTAVDWTRIIIAIFAVALLLTIGYIGHNTWQESEVEEAAAQLKSYRTLPQLTSVEICTHLHKVLHPPSFRLRAYRDQSLDAFHTSMSIAPQKMMTLFTDDNCPLEHKTLFIEAFYQTLAYTDWDRKEDTTLLILEAMSEADTQYRPEIEAWVDARRMWEEGDKEAALSAYGRAIEEYNDKNPATLWERSRLLIHLGKYLEAAEDLEEVMKLAALLGEEDLAEAASTSSASPTIIAVTNSSSVSTDAVTTEADETTTNNTETTTLPPESRIVLGAITARFSTRTEIELAVSQLIQSSSNLQNTISESHPNLQEILRLQAWTLIEQNAKCGEVDGQIALVIQTRQWWETIAAERKIFSISTGRVVSFLFRLDDANQAGRFGLRARDGGFVGLVFHQGDLYPDYNLGEKDWAVNSLSIEQQAHVWYQAIIGVDLEGRITWNVQPENPPDSASRGISYTLNAQDSNAYFRNQTYQFFLHSGTRAESSTLYLRDYREDGNRVLLCPGE